MAKYRIYSIKYDASRDEQKELPKELIADIDISQYNEDEVDDILETELSDYISDYTGYCHEGFEYEEIRE